MQKNKRQKKLLEHSTTNFAGIFLSQKKNCYFIKRQKKPLEFYIKKKYLFSNSKYNILSSKTSLAPLKKAK